MAMSFEWPPLATLAAASCLAFVAGCSAIFQRTPAPDARVQEAPTAHEPTRPCFPERVETTPAGEGTYFDHVLVIVFENQPYDAVQKNNTFKRLAAEGANLTNFHALFHPSYPNYLAMVSGTETLTIADIQRTVDKPSIACLLYRKGFTWRNYAESYPAHETDCNTVSAVRPLYARKHVPFLSFRDIQENFRNGCSNVVSADDLFEALDQRNPIPNYMFFSPNLFSDGHDKATDSPYSQLEYSARWLARFLDRIEGYPDFRRSTLIVVTFDESAASDSGNHIYTVLRGPMVKRGCFDETYTHYSVLRMVEDNFGLGTISDGDGSARPVTTDVFTKERPCEEK